MARRLRRCSPTSTQRCRRSAASSTRPACSMTGSSPTQDATRVVGVLAPKVAGAWNLHEQTADRELDLFVMYSSLAATIGSPGQSAYTAGNAFLDALAHHRNEHGLPATSIGWGPWAGAGLGAAASVRPPAAVGRHQAARRRRCARRPRQRSSPDQRRTSSSPTSTGRRWSRSCQGRRCRRCCRTWPRQRPGARRARLVVDELPRSWRPISERGARRPAVGGGGRRC